MTTTLTPDRQTFRALVADVAARAKAILPTEVNGRVEKAVTLVLLGEVAPQANGTVQVGSCSDASKVYTLQGTTCDCADYLRAPESWCKHRIAAGIHKRVSELLPPAPEPEPIPEPPPVEPWPDNDPEPVAPTVPPAPLPEAPASVNVRLTIAGREVQLTLRDTSEERLLVRLEEVLQRFPLPRAQPASPQPLSLQQHNAAAMHRPVTDFCPVHHVAMKENTKDGRRWYSHYDETAGRWCKGR